MPDMRKAISQVLADLDQVRQVKKCASCECLLDVLDAIQADLGEIDTPQAKAARVDMKRWLEEGNKKRHQCLGCEVCLPIEPYNRFSALLHGDNPAMAPETPDLPPCDCGGT